MKSSKPKNLIIYENEDGIEPFTKWLFSLRDSLTRQRIETRLARLEQGNYGDVKAIGEGLSELRLFFGSGYRVYFGEQEDCIVVLLCGGDKNSQKKDIKEAKAYWKEYLNHA
ncbi:MAG: type II toxin-antitoxin system RelE/ParE family toxin [Pseudomonadota bacterium]